MRQFYLVSSLALLCLLLFQLPAQGQSTVENEEGEIKMMVRHSIIHWMDPFLPSALVGVDYRIGPKQYLRHEIGYFFEYSHDAENSLLNLNGLRLRTAYRKYRRTALPSRRSTYLEWQLDYRYLDLEIAGDFWRDNFSFQQRIDYRAWQHSFTANVLVGQSRTIGEHWRIDLGIGLGFRLNHRRFSPVPEDTNFNTNGQWTTWNYDFRRGYSVGLGMPIVLAIGYWW